MGIFNEQPSSTSTTSSGVQGLQGLGFKLNSDGDYDMENKKLVNVKQGTNNNDVVTKSYLDSEITKIPSVDTTQFVKKTGATMNGDLILQPQPYPIHGNTDKAISYNTARNIFLSKKEGGSMLQSLDMNNHFITNIKDPVNSDHGVNKKYVENQLEKKLDKGADIDMKNKSIINLDLPSNQRDAACVEFVNNRIDDMTQKKFLKVDGTNNMTGNLNLNEKTIINLNTDDKDIKSAANVGYVSSKVRTAKGDVTVGLKTYFDTKIKESHITSSTNKKDVFRYLMENADEPSSENNIIVDGIVDFSGSPHNVNKKAYKFKMGKDAQNEYSSRIGFNMFKLPEGEYTLAIEFFPPSTTNLSVSVVSTSLNIGQQSTKLFVNYSRSIVHLHKWNITPPEYIYIDMHCQGTASSSTQGVGYLIVYGVKGSQSNVDSDVYDTAYVVENGKMVMQTDLSLNGHQLRSSIHHINGFLNSRKGNKNFVLNGAEIMSLPGEAILKNIDIYCTRPITSSDSHVTVHRHKKISLKLKTSLRNFFTVTLSSSRNFTSKKSGWYQTINLNSFQMPSSGILAFELNMNDDIWKSYNAIILRIEYQTSA